MNKAQFDHTVRAAGAVLGVDDILVIGSQAVHASIDQIFPEAARSIEVDVAGLDAEDPARAADLIDGSIGELSLFQDSFGYYAQGVTPDTAVLPDGWRERLIPYRSEATGNVTAWCLEPNDLWLSKAAAGREKDREFCAALIEVGLVDEEVLRERVGKMRALSSDKQAVISRWIETLDGDRGVGDRTNK